MVSWCYFEATILIRQNNNNKKSPKKHAWLVSISPRSDSETKIIQINIKTKLSIYKYNFTEFKIRKTDR